MDRTAYLPGNDSFLGVQVPLDHRAFRNQNLGADPHRSPYPPLYSHDPLGLQVTDYCHVAGDNRKRDLIRPPTLELVPLIIPGGTGKDAH
jgi:hypothetical protein